jgi:hypothetical protein
MEESNQSTAKFVLSVTTYKPLDGKPDVSLPTSDHIDITDLLKVRGIQSLYSINGVSEYDTATKDKYGSAPAYTHFVIAEEEIIEVANDIYRIIDAAIVNSKQAEAIKSLVKDSTEKLIQKCWDRIRG